MSLYYSKSSENSRKSSPGYQWQEGSLKNQLFTEPEALLMSWEWIFVHEYFLQITDPLIPLHSEGLTAKGEIRSALCTFKPCQVPSRENQKAVPNTLQYPVVLCLQNWALTNTSSSLFLADLFPAASYLPSSNFSSLPNLSSVKENLQGKKLQQQCCQWKINPILHTTLSMLIMPTRLLQWKNRRLVPAFFTNHTNSLWFSFYLAYLNTKTRIEVKNLTFHQSQNQSQGIIGHI